MDPRAIIVGFAWFSSVPVPALPAGRCENPGTEGSLGLLGGFRLMSLASVGFACDLEKNRVAGYELTGPVLASLI